MLKNRVACVLLTLAISLGMGAYFVVPTSVYAEGEQAQNEEPTIINSADDLYGALYWGGNYKLGSNINTGDSTYGNVLYAIISDTILDLGNYTLTLSGANACIWTYGSNLTIKGSENGKIVKAVNEPVPAVGTYQGDVVFESGSIEAPYYGATISTGTKFTMNGGSIYGGEFGIVGYGTSETTIIGGTVTSDHISVSGYGVENGTKFNINGGTLNGTDTGLYLPHANGETTITDGTIISDKTGVEIRAGSLDISGGTISSTAILYSATPNGNGTTTTGAAVAVSQHTTKQPINVTISGGTFTAPAAFYEVNPQGNSAEDVAKISVNITNGKFEGAIDSEDLTDFLHGGLFTTKPTEEDIISGYEAEQNDDSTWNIVPVEIDWEGRYKEAFYNEDYTASVEINSKLIADRLASLSASVVEDLDTLKLTNGGLLLGALDLNLVDRENVRIEVNDTDLTVYIDIDEETYKELAKFDKIYAVYFNDDGVEEERIEAKLMEEGDWWWIEFNTTHLSTYGIVGVNEESSEPTSAPETGTMTATGASAMTAALVTAIAVGILTSIVSFAYLIRRR